MDGRLIVIEGLDGSGKSTQIALLRERMEARGTHCDYLHFPMLNGGRYGEMIAEFLRGEYGALDAVHPKLAALLFANDRKEHLEKIARPLAAGHVVLADRYVFSNIAFQCAKLDSADEKAELKRWILDFEFTYNRLPQPHHTFYLDVPLPHIAHTLAAQRAGDDRAYLKGKSDIHESSLALQRKVEQEYRQLVDEQPHFTRIPCCDDTGNRLSAKQVSQLILAHLAG
jgi:dTMP kinase